MKIKIVLIFLCACYLVLLALPAFAALTDKEKAASTAATAGSGCTGVGNFGELNFCPNVGIGEFQKTGTPIPVDQSTLGKYISAWYGFVIGTVGILAAIMIMWGGIKWMTSRGGQAVSEAKDIIFSALIGLTLAFLSYTILNLVNPKLLTLGLTSLSQMTAIQYNGDFEMVPVAAPYTDPERNNAVVTREGIQLTGADAGPQREGESTAAAIARNAEAAIGVPTSNVPGTDGGNLACAYSVNEITRNALGEPIGGGLSTQAMAETLRNNPDYVATPNANLNPNNLQPGDIIISPTGDPRLKPEHGHVGVYIGNGQIVSNVASQGQIGTPYNVSQWTEHYGFFDAYRPK